MASSANDADDAPFSLDHGDTRDKETTVLDIKDSDITLHQTQLDTGTSEGFEAVKLLIQQLPVKLMKDILLYENEDKEDPSYIPTTAQKFEFFMIWYPQNKDSDASSMKIILDSFKLEDFSGKELLTVVKKSGLFSEEVIEKKCIEKFEYLED